MRSCRYLLGLFSIFLIETVVVPASYGLFILFAFLQAKRVHFKPYVPTLDRETVIVFYPIQNWPKWLSIGKFRITPYWLLVLFLLVIANWSMSFSTKVLMILCVLLVLRQLAYYLVRLGCWIDEKMIKLN